MPALRCTSKRLHALVGALCVLLATVAAAQVDSGLVIMSDAPDPAFARPQSAAGPRTYDEAVREWSSSDAINAWIGSSFRYDRGRALALSETTRAANVSTAVIEPEAFFAHPRGVCIDLARFAVSTLRRVDPQSRGAYLMIEFEPVEVAGQVLRRHWLATFERGGKRYFFADSKRPGHMAGPYDSVDAFIVEYGAYRGRPIVSYKVLEGYERRIRKRSAKALRSGNPQALPRIEHRTSL